MGSAIVYEFMNVNIMQSLTQTSLTIDEFLSSPLANENYEFFDGELTEKMSPKRSHSRVQGRLLILLDDLKRQG